MSFIDSYKRLEKLCNEIYGSNRGLSAYIDDMLNNPSGTRYVEDWNETLKQLKHYRWIRNQIVHEPNCNEENMCVSDDILWLDKFYSRILSSSDPISLYRKSRNQASTQRLKQTYSSSEVRRTYEKSRSSTSYVEHTYSPITVRKVYKKRASKRNKRLGIIIGLLYILIVAVVIIYLANKML